MMLVDLLSIAMHLLYCFLRPIFALVYLRKRPKIPPIKNQLLFDSATTLARKIRSGEISSQTIVEAYIERIKEVNPFLNAVVEERFVEAVNDAKICDAKLKSGEVTAVMLENEKPLFGIPFTVKESCSVAGLSLTGGYPKRKGMKAPADGALVQVFKRAGAIPLCVTNTPELCLSVHTNNPIYGLTRNPYDTRRTVGGSSGGEGALLGAGASILGIGSDLLGSIRIPSLFNGIFGHKPTPGIIPNGGHMVDFSQNLMFVQGPLTRYAEDLQLAVKVMSVDCDRPLHLDEPLDLKTLRVFYVENIESFCGIRSTTSDIRQSIKKALRHLSENGARVEHMSQDWVRNSTMYVWSTFQDDDLLKSLKDNKFEEPRSPMFNHLKSVLGCGNDSFLFATAQMVIINRGFLPLSKSAQYNAMKEKMRQNINNQLGSNGVFIYPTLPQAAPYAIAMNFLSSFLNYTTIANAMHMPSTHVPMGLNNKGLPIGFQVMAGTNQDRLCLAVARELEKAFGGWVRPTS